MGLFSKKLKIEPWKPGYYPDITVARKRQQDFFSQLSKKIRSSEYVDVGDNVAYLLCFGYEINKQICANERNVFYHATNDYRKYIHLYGKVTPKTIIYAFPWLIFSEIKTNEPIQSIADDFESVASILSENNIYGYSDLLTALYIKGLNINSSSRIPTFLLRFFAGNDLRKYLTDIGKNAYDAVLKNAYSIIDHDFEECHFNYLYQMYDYEEGVISAQQMYNLTYSSKSNYTNYGLKYPELNVMIPINNSRCDQYLQMLMREAENMYRRNAGLPGVGEGWVSETLLFRQIEAAFPNTTVSQHASPSFLGRQHYDIYMPEYKIALEYQGEQHFSPIDIFGGEEGFKNSQARDKKKKQLSTRNSVALIEVLPGYDISNVIKSILQLMYGDVSQNEYRLNEALSQVESLKMNQVESGKLADATGSLKKKQKSAGVTDAEISACINEMLHNRQTPQFDTDETRLAEATDLMLKKLDEVCEISKTDPALSNQKAWELYESGYRYPALFNRMAINYRKMGLVEEEIDVLVNLKRMYPESSDDRLRKLLKKKLLG